MTNQVKTGSEDPLNNKKSKIDELSESEFLLALLNNKKSKIDELLSDQKILENLLLKEKERRGMSKDKLVFIGIANIANYYWCAMKAFFESQKEELGFFAAYLEDRLLYSYRLGFIKKLPKSKAKRKLPKRKLRLERLLEVGSKIEFRDIEKLLKKVLVIIDGKFVFMDREEFLKREEKSEETQNISCITTSISAIDENGNEIVVMNPDLPPEEKAEYEKLEKESGARVVNPEDFPMLRGELFELTKAEHYPSIRWNFNWNDYVVLGIPDGITDDFVYEFKTTRNRFLMWYLKPVAQAQADLYGYFFKRNKKRVQIYIVEEEVTETWEETIDVTKAIETLNNFKRIEEGIKPPPPRRWKCKKCEFKESCKI